MDGLENRETAGVGVRAGFNINSNDKMIKSWKKIVMQFMYHEMGGN